MCTRAWFQILLQKRVLFFPLHPPPSNGYGQNNFVLLPTGDAVLQVQLVRFCLFLFSTLVWIRMLSQQSRFWFPLPNQFSTLTPRRACSPGWRPPGYRRHHGRRRTTYRLGLGMDYHRFFVLFFCMYIIYSSIWYLIWYNMRKTMYILWILY